MFMFLYGMPVLIPRYSITSEQDYYRTHCLPQLMSHDYPILAIPSYCNWMNVCGFDYQFNNSRNTGEGRDCGGGGTLTGYSATAVACKEGEGGCGGRLQSLNDARALAFGG